MGAMPLLVEPEENPPADTLGLNARLEETARLLRLERERALNICCG